MELNKLDIRLIDRSNSQTVNLGFATARRYRWCLLRVGLISMLPIFLIAVLLTLWFDLYLAGALLLWWCKPYYERVILFHANRLMYKETLKFTNVLDSLGRVLGNDFWLAITFWRFSSDRSVITPIALLERRSGKDLANRIKFLKPRCRKKAGFVTLGLWQIEVVLYINAVLLTVMLMPSEMREELPRWLLSLHIGESADHYRWLSVLLLFFQLLVMLIVSSFYVMAGFMLYINNRVIVDGWDIEVGFKLMAQRLRQFKKRRFAVVAATLLACNVGFSDMSYAQSTDASAPVQTVPATTSTLSDPTLSDSKAQKTEKKAVQRIRTMPEQAVLTPVEDKRILRELLLDERHNPYAIKVFWKSKYDKDARSVYAGVGDAESQQAELGTLLRILWLLAIVFALLVAYSVFAKRHQIQALINSKKQRDDQEAPTVMFGLDISEESLPENIYEEAKRLLEDKEHLAVLSLLYRGCLSSLINYFDVPIKESDTEGDCLRLSKHRVSELSYSYFGELTEVWQGVIYAHLVPNHILMQELVNGWLGSFSPAAIEARLKERASDG